MNTHRTLVGLLYSGLAIFCCLSAQAANSGPTLDTGIVAYNNEGDVIELHALDNPTNPFLGEYGERDYWVLANIDHEAQANQAWQYVPNVVMADGKKPDRKDHLEGWTTLRAIVDENGFLVPNGMMPKGWVMRPPPGKVKDALRHFGAPQTNTNPPLFYIDAAGVMAAEKLQEFNNAAIRKKAVQYPLIPAWLGEQPPLRTMFIPGGDIVVFGALGVELGENRSAYGRGMNQVGNWYHLDHDGKLLGQTGLVREHSKNWYSFFFTDYEDVFLGWQEKSNYRTSKPGVVIFGQADEIIPYAHLLPDQPAPTLLAAFTYDGQPLDSEDEIPTYGKYEFSTMFGAQVRQIYLGQVELGLVDPLATASPWVGKAGGAVVYDPSTAGTGKYASSRAGLNETMVEVKPFDDPDNPYAGKYGAWDHFIYENEGKSNPRHRGQYAEMHNTQRDKITALVKAGKDVPKELLQSRGIPVDPDDPWKHYTAQVDSQGYLIPMVLNQQRQRCRPIYITPIGNSQSEPSFRFSSGGIMPEDMAQAYSQAIFEGQMELLPAIPKWLSASPVHSAIPCPGGEWVTYGELGSWAKFVDASREDQRKKYKRLRLHRYSEDGELLEVAARFEQFWQRFYSPEAAAILDEVNSSMGTMGASSRNSFIQVFKSDPACEDGG